MTKQPLGKNSCLLIPKKTGRKAEIMGTRWLVYAHLFLNFIAKGDIPFLKGKGMFTKNIAGT